MTATSPVTLRPATEADLPLLQRIYSGTRQTELANVPWTDEQKETFLAMQFHAQHTDYHQNYADAAFDIVEREGVPVGRLYLQQCPDEVRILDIAILPEHRSQGLGTALLNEVISDAVNVGKPVTIHVEKYNPALRLYQRLGFVEIGGNDVYLLMERLPQPLFPSL